MNNLILHTVIVIIMSTLWACSPKATPKTTQPISMPQNERPVTPLSDIVLDIHISKTAITDSVGTLIDSILSESIELPDQEVKLYLQRKKNVSLELSGQDLLMTLPLHIHVQKNTVVGWANATGEVDMTFKSRIDIDSSWHLSTATELIDHKWTVTPKLVVFGIGIPIKGISNAILKKTRTDITNSIDESISQNMDLPERMRSMTSSLLSPYQIDSTAGGWLTPACSYVSASPIISDQDYISTRLSLPMTIAVRSEQIEIDSSTLPPFIWRENPNDTCQINVHADLSYKYLGDLARTQFVNQTFSNDGKSVTVQDIRVSGAPNRIDVEVKTTGSFSGTLMLSCTPVYENGILRAEQIRWSVKTKNILHRTASWLAKGYIHDKIESMLTFDLRDYIETAKKEIEKQLIELESNKQVKSSIEWYAIDLTHLRSTDEGLQALLSARLKATIDINNLRSIH